MTDITKCTGMGCPIRDTCYRYTAQVSSKRQAWHYEVPGRFNGKIWECALYYERSEKPNKTKYHTT